MPKFTKLDPNDVQIGRGRSAHEARRVAGQNALSAVRSTPHGRPGAASANCRGAGRPIRLGHLTGRRPVTAGRLSGRFPPRVARGKRRTSRARDGSGFTRRGESGRLQRESASYTRAVLPFDEGAVGDPQGQPDAGTIHLPSRDAQEVAGGELVLEDDQHVGADAMVVGGALRGVVAEVGGEAGGHRGGPHRAALPLEKERPALAVTAQDAEGVRVNRVQDAALAEVARRAVRRFELRHIPALAASLLRQRGDETAHGLGVVEVAQQLVFRVFTYSMSYVSRGIERNLGVGER